MLQVHDRVPGLRTSIAASPHEPVTESASGPTDIRQEETSAVLQPFHLAFPVSNIEQSKEFYGRSAPYLPQLCTAWQPI